MILATVCARMLVDRQVAGAIADREPEIGSVHACERPGRRHRSAFALASLPVDGIAAMGPDEDHDLETVDARLPPALRPLVAGIIADFRRASGLAASTGRR